MRTRKSHWPFWPRYHGAMTPSRSSTTGWAKYFFTGGASAAIAETVAENTPSRSKTGVKRCMANSLCIRCEWTWPRGSLPRAGAPGATGFASAFLAVARASTGRASGTQSAVAAAFRAGGKSAPLEYNPPPALKQQPTCSPRETRKVLRTRRVRKSGTRRAPDTVRKSLYHLTFLSVLSVSPW